MRVSESAQSLPIIDGREQNTVRARHPSERKRTLLPYAPFCAVSGAVLKLVTALLLSNNKHEDGGSGKFLHYYLWMRMYEILTASFEWHNVKAGKLKVSDEPACQSNKRSIAARHSNLNQPGRCS